MMNLIYLFVGMLLIMGTDNLWAGETHKDHGQPVKSAEENLVKREKIAVGNKICPVSGEKIGKMGEAVTYEYNGKVYNLCCPMCAKDFKKDPEKYSKIAEEEAARNK